MSEIKEKVEDLKESMCHGGTCVSMHQFCTQRCCVIKCLAVTALLVAVFAAGCAAGGHGRHGHGYDHDRDGYGEYRHSRNEGYGDRRYGYEQGVRTMPMMSNQGKMMISAPLDQAVPVQQVVPTSVAPTVE